MIHRPLALANAVWAREALSACRLCGHRCGAARKDAPGGLCGAPPEGRIFYEQIESGGEAELVPTYALGFSGCNFRCSFCITGVCSQNAATGHPLDLSAIEERITAAAGRVRSVTILGGEPSIHLPTALRIAALVPSNLPLVWKSNAYTAPEALWTLENVFDVVLADYKFGSEKCAKRLAAVDVYAPIVQENLKWARAHTRLIVRHLLMPGHLECCFIPVIDWLAKEMPEVPLSLMPGFLPLFESYRTPELMRILSASEVQWAKKRVLERGLTLAPWAVAPNDVPSAAGSETEIWIDRQGRVHTPSLLPEMAAWLQQLDLNLSL